MSRKKISTNGTDLPNINAGFSGLDIQGLPVHKAVEPTREKPGTRSKHRSARNGRAEIRREKAGRGGKTVTTIKIVETKHSYESVADLAVLLRKRCACGGTSKERIIELQGDLRDSVFEELENLNFTPVLAGG